MIIAFLLVVGLALGSFVNALVWRLHEGRDWVHERSECPHCHHQLAVKDLVPVLSWLWLKGRCRYCKQPIDDSPLVEASLSLLFVLSYIYWPFKLDGIEIVIFGIWLALLTGLIALLVYDLRWMILPNKLIFPLMFLAGVTTILKVIGSNQPTAILQNTILAMVVGGGIFYLVFQLSNGRWIGGGDVKLGFLLGVILGTPAKSLLVIFLSSLLGSLASLPLLASKRLKATSQIPFGPFLIVAAIIVQFFGTGLLVWYQNLLTF